LLLGLAMHPPGHEPNPKIDGWVAGGSGPGPVIAGRGCERRWWSGGGVEGDPVAEGLELADVVELFAFGVDAGVVEVRAEVVEAGVGVAQQVPDDDEDGAADGDDGFLLAAAAGDAPVAFAEEGVGLAGGHGDLAENPGQV